jgi:hypothetical protein
MTFHGIEFYILCYNSLFCCEYQIKCINQFCKDEFKIIIIDSNQGCNLLNSKQKELICKQKKVDFITLPDMPEIQKNDSASIILGKKLNYVYYNYVLQRNPKYFAFIDQDMFMVKPFTVIDFLEKNGMWGDVMEVGNYPKSGGNNGMEKQNINENPWVLHPWLSFYKLDFVKPYKLNFLPGGKNENGDLQFDTGGENYEAFIRKINVKKETYWMRENIIMYYPFYEISNVGPSPYEKHYFNYNNEKVYGQIQFNNGFMHLLCSSKISDDPFHPKFIICKGMLDGILLSNSIIFDKSNGYETINSPTNKM